MPTPQALFIFHRDLRLEDNTALLAAIKSGYQVLACFIFTPEQISPITNPFFSNPAVQFMCESLAELNERLDSKLLIVHDHTLSAIQKIYSKSPFEAIFFNKDYSKYAVDRDADIEAWCKKTNVQCSMYEDYGLLPLHDGLLEAGRPYRVLSQFYKKFQKSYTVRKPNRIKKAVTTANFSTPPSLRSITIANSDLSRFYTPNPMAAMSGGRFHAMAKMKRIGTLKNYKEERDFPALQKTTLLSPYLKFGCVSIREVYWEIYNKLGGEHALIRELVFRDFYMKIYALDPKLQRGKALHDKLDHTIDWSYDKKIFNAWTSGLTGFPLVDAGMRELNQTGHQHNRIRMLCSSVLAKYFLIDWRWGLKYYYTHLVDADIFSNTAGWGFSSSTGPDAVPYFRPPFNPFIQSKKFDVNAEYIKKWVPELADIPPSDIHKWFDENTRTKYSNTSYVPPIIDHKFASSRAMKVFKEAYERSKKE
jgi:deoxyribodipyrimidine photo-lyase